MKIRVGQGFDVHQLVPDRPLILGGVTDSSYANIDSRILLRDVMQKLAGQGWAVGNADLTIVAQAPKLAAHIPAMRERLAEDMQTEVGQINIKATTTEKLGFCGREEGISALACVLIQESDA